MSCTNLQALPGQIKWYGIRDKDGYKDYYLTQLVKVDDTPGSAHGPASVFAAAGLPIPGVSSWVIDGDSDPFAICQRDSEARPVYEKERCEFFEVTTRFSNRPDPLCFWQLGTGTGTGNYTDEPLLIPPKVSGSFFKRTKQAIEGRNIDDDLVPITNSAFERIKGPEVEIDTSLPTVIIEVNKSELDLVTLSLLIDAVNETAMWGFGEKLIKLTDISWQKLYYTDCTCYFNIRFEFTINHEGWAIRPLDEGTKALNGRFNQETGEWQLEPINGVAPDPNNPAHFIRIQDRHDNIISSALNGMGVPVTSIDDAAYVYYEVYPAYDFFFYIPELPTDLECP